mgnify:CR=1 FL=1
MFEKATRLKLRFPYKGQCSVEDLWDMSVEVLDGIYKTLNKQVKETEGESLLETESPKNTTLGLQIDILKHVVKIKLQEKADRAEAKEKALRKEKIMDIIAQKQDESLKNMSIEVLSKMI